MTQILKEPTIYIYQIEYLYSDDRYGFIYTTAEGMSSWLKALEDKPILGFHRIMIPESSLDIYLNCKQ